MHVHTSFLNVRGIALAEWNKVGSIKGAAGAKGATGAAGAGIATGGTAGQFLRKTNSNNYATYWGSVSHATLGTVPVANGGTSATAAGYQLLKNIGITVSTGAAPTTGTYGTIWIQY